jgi:glycosidase
MHVSEKLARGEAGVHDIYNVLHEYAGYPEGSIKLLYTSNHDENSWNGTEYEKYGPAAKPWAVFAHTWKGMPLLYSGQEIPNTKRLQFFDKDPIQWTSTPSLHEFYKTLLQLRKDYPALVIGASFNLPSSDHNVMAYIRHLENQVVLVVLNVSTEHITIQCNHELLKGKFKQVFSGMQYTFDEYVSFELMPGDYFVYTKL